jgi:hypothetical protein
MSQDILSEGHIREIGRLVVNVSKLDSLMTDLISEFGNVSLFATVMMVDHQQISSKIDTLLALIRAALQDMDDSQIQVLIDPILRTKEVADYRNTVVHALWVIEKDGTTSAVRFQARGRFKRTKTPASPIDIGAQADKAFALVREVSALRDHFHDFVPPPETEEAY